MQLSATLLALLAATPIVMAGCGADGDSDPGVAETALTNQAADGSVVAPDGGTVTMPSSDPSKSPPVLPTDPCPGCGLG
jgi:hypothetical protein